MLATETRALLLLAFFLLQYFRLVFYLGTAALQLGDMLGIRSVSVDGETAAVAGDAADGCSDLSQDTANSSTTSHVMSPAQQEQARIEEDV